jgi:hypothetical protein
MGNHAGTFMLNKPLQKRAFELDSLLDFGTRVHYNTTIGHPETRRIRRNDEPY